MNIIRNIVYKQCMYDQMPTISPQNKKKYINNMNPVGCGLLIILLINSNHHFQHVRPVLVHITVPFYKKKWCLCHLQLFFRFLKKNIFPPREISEKNLPSLLIPEKTEWSLGVNVVVRLV